MGDDKQQPAPTQSVKPPGKPTPPPNQTFKGGPEPDKPEPGTIKLVEDR